MYISDNKTCQPLITSFEVVLMPDWTFFCQQMCNVTLHISMDMLTLYATVARKNWINNLLAALEEASIIIFQNAYVFLD